MAKGKVRLLMDGGDWLGSRIGVKDAEGLEEKPEFHGPIGNKRKQLYFLGCSVFNAQV
jgi:hypothetical protein